MARIWPPGLRGANGETDLESEPMLQTRASLISAKAEQRLALFADGQTRVGRMWRKVGDQVRRRTHVGLSAIRACAVVG